MMEPSPPGATIAELMSEQNIKKDYMSRSMGLTATEFQQLLDGDLQLTKHIAKQLEIIFKVSHQFWLVREHNYRRNSEVYKSTNQD
jgi:plasmid maintenance system antidote protein VapI